MLMPSYLGLAYIIVDFGWSQKEQTTYTGYMTNILKLLPNRYDFYFGLC